MKLILFLSLSFFAFSPLWAQDELLEPTSKAALVDVLVVDFDSIPYIGQAIIFVNTKTKKQAIRKTNEKGKFQILLPKGHQYSIKFKEITSEFEYSKINIPESEDELLAYSLVLSYRPSKNFTLENVFFDTGKATLKANSFSAIDKLAEALVAKPTLEIEIAGHTDNQGSSLSNQKLSQKRAESVKNYLVQKKKIASRRIIAKGYGDTMPVVKNDTAENRQKNRRTEVRVLQQ